VDGKTLRGTGQDEQKRRHLLAAGTDGSARTVGQRAVGEGTREIPEAPRLLAELDLRGKAVTADAMHARKELAEAVVRTRRGMRVGGQEQPENDAQSAGRPGLVAFHPRYSERDRGHGRLEERTIQLRTRVAGLRCSHAAQGLRGDGTGRLHNGKVRQRAVYGVSRMGADRADEKAILGYLRGPWTIGALHRIRDVRYCEDRGRIRTGHGAEAMAALRNLAIGVIETLMPGRVAGARRRLLMQPEQLRQLLGA
jgi:predicted transposase YbfD/YdcC